MIRTALPVAALILATSACTPMPPRGAMPPGAAGACNAEPAAWAIGRAVEPRLVDRVVHDTGSRGVRVIHPGDPVTMDYRRDRVNIKVNERGAIYSISCG